MLSVEAPLEPPRSLRRADGVTQHESVMGVVRVQAKISNPHDDYRARYGQIKPEAVRRVVVDALGDTGAVRSIIPRHVLEELGVETFGELRTTFADGRWSSIPLTGALLFDVMDRHTFEDALVMGDEVLIGHTVLEKLDLWVDVKGRRVVGNPDHPDEAIFRV